MLAQARAAVVMLGALTVLTGAAYPLFVTGLAQAAFPSKANGSLVERGGRTAGSALIGQPFDDPKYFWSRPSATTPAYNGAASAASNLGPTNPALTEAAKQRIDALHAADPENVAPVPVNLVTASGSGLDPHISVAAALYQVTRVRKARGMAPGDDAKLRALIERYTEGPGLGILGEAGVNVLALNLALDGRD